MTDRGQSFWAVSDTGEMFKFLPELQDGRIAKLEVWFIGVLKKPNGDPLKVGDGKHRETDRDPESLAKDDCTLYVSTENVPTIYSYKLIDGEPSTQANPNPWVVPNSAAEFLRRAGGNDGLEALTPFRRGRSCGLLGFAQVNYEDSDKWPAWFFGYDPKCKFAPESLNPLLISSSKGETHVVAASTFKDEVFVLIRETADRNSNTQDFRISKVTPNGTNEPAVESVYETKEPLQIGKGNDEFGVVEGLAVFEYKSRLHALIVTDTVNNEPPLSPDSRLMMGMILIDLAN